MRENVFFEQSGVDIICHLRERSYVFKKLNQSVKKELITGLFFDQLIAYWDIDFILDTIIKRDNDNFFIEKVAPKLLLSYSTAVEILTKKVGFQEHAELIIEYMVREKFYEREKNNIKFFPDCEIYSKCYVHSMNAYLRSVSIRISNSKELLSLDELSSYFSEKRSIEYSHEDKLKYFADECKSILSRGLNETLNDKDIHQLIQNFADYILLNKIVYPDKRIKWISKNRKLEEASEIHFKALIASEIIKKERERLKKASEINELIEDIKSLPIYQDKLNDFM